MTAAKLYTVRLSLGRSRYAVEVVALDEEHAGAEARRVAETHGLGASDAFTVANVREGELTDEDRALRDDSLVEAPDPLTRAAIEAMLLNGRDAGELHDAVDGAVEWIEAHPQAGADRVELYAMLSSDAELESRWAALAHVDRGSGTEREKAEYRAVVAEAGRRNLLD